MWLRSNDHIEVGQEENKAALIFFESGEASVQTLQKRFGIGYGRSAQIIYNLEEAGVVGPFAKSGTRKLLISKDEYLSRVNIKVAQTKEQTILQKLLSEIAGMTEEEMDLMLEKAIKIKQSR